MTLSPNIHVLIYIVKRTGTYSVLNYVWVGAEGDREAGSLMNREPDGRARSQDPRIMT